MCTSPGIGHDCSRSHRFGARDPARSPTSWSSSGKFRGPMSRPSSTRWDGILRVRLKRSNALAGIRTELAAGLMAGVGPGLRNVRRHGWWSLEICPGPSSIWCSSPALVASGSTTYGTRVRRCFWRRVCRPCRDGRAGPFSAFDHHGYVLPCDVERLARCRRCNGSGAEWRSMTLDRCCQSWFDGDRQT